MKYYVHVHQNRIRQGLPAITVKRGRRGKSVYASEVAFTGTVVQGGEGQLPCGAKVSIVCDEPPVVIR